MNSKNETMSTYHKVSIASVPSRSNNSLKNDTGTDINNLSRDFSFYCAIFMVTVCLVGMFGNALSIYVFSRKSMRRSSINTLLLGLSIIDFLLVLICPIIFAIAPIIHDLPTFSNEEDMRIVYTVNAYSSVYAYPFAMILQTSSVWIFLVITAERFLAVCHPLQVGMYCTVARARISLLVVFTLSTMYNLVRFWEFKLVNSTTADGALRKDKSYWLWYGTIAYLITQFAVPFILIAVLNSTVVNTIYKAKRARARLTSSERSEHRTGIMMLTVVLIFVLCYTLSFILNISEAADKDLFSVPPKSNYAFMVNDISNTLVTFNSASTWIIYLLFSRKYRVLSMRLMFSILPKYVLNRLVTNDFRTLEETNIEQSYIRKHGTAYTNTNLMPTSGKSITRTSFAHSNQLLPDHGSPRSRSGSNCLITTPRRLNSQTSSTGTPRAVYFRTVSTPNGTSQETTSLILQTKQSTVTNISNSSMIKHMAVEVTRI